MSHLLACPPGRAQARSRGRRTQPALTSAPSRVVATAEQDTWTTPTRDRAAPVGSENRSAPDPRGTPRSLSPPPRASLGTSASFSRLWRATHRQQEASSEEQVPVCHGPGPGIRILYAEFATQSDPRHTPIYQAGNHHGRAQTHNRHPPAANTPVNLAGTHRHTDQ